MQLRQLQVANDSVQDRLVLRVATANNEEFRVYLTRRFLREIWPHLSNMLAGHLKAAQLASAPPRPPEEAPTFEQPFKEDNPNYPLGSTPLLASEAVLEAAGDGAARLTLREGRERSLNLNLNSELLQALCAMLRAANTQAGWDLVLEYGTPPAIAGTPVKSLLH